MLTSQSFWGKALIVTIHNKSLCLGQWLHINFSDCANSACIVLSYTKVPINTRLPQPLYWKCIFEQNLYVVRYVYCPHEMSLPTSRGSWDPILLQYEFLAPEVLACNMKTSIQTHSNKSYLLIIFVLCYRPKYSIIKLKFIMSSITIKEWVPRGPFIEFSILCRIILTKKEILHETEVMIHGVSIVDCRL